MNLDTPRHLSKEDSILWDKLTYYDSKLERVPEYFNLFFAFLNEESGTMSRECYGDCIVHECPYGSEFCGDSELFGLDVIREVLKILDEGGELID